MKNSCKKIVNQEYATLFLTWMPFSQRYFREHCTGTTDQLFISNPFSKMRDAKKGYVNFRLV